MARIVLLGEVLDSFYMIWVGSDDTEIHAHLDEKLCDTLCDDVHFEPKGFIPEVPIVDFSIRDFSVSSSQIVRYSHGQELHYTFKMAAEGTR